MVDMLPKWLFMAVLPGFAAYTCYSFGRRCAVPILAGLLADGHNTGDSMRYRPVNRAFHQVHHTHLLLSKCVENVKFSNR